jgi:hypothetical protein
LLEARSAKVVVADSSDFLTDVGWMWLPRRTSDTTCAESSLPPSETLYPSLQETRESWPGCSRDRPARARSGPSQVPNTWKFYKVNTLILGGDIIARSPSDHRRGNGHYWATLQAPPSTWRPGRPQTLTDRIETLGFYQDDGRGQYNTITADPDKVTALFHELPASARRVVGSPPAATGTGAVLRHGRQ